MIFTGTNTEFALRELLLGTHLRSVSTRPHIKGPHILIGLT